MHHTKRNRTIALLMSAQLVALGFVQPATAGVVSTETAIELSQREATIERIDAVSTSRTGSASGSTGESQ
jgi:hypothetical protein